jgi:hypothetical protein
MKKTFTSGVVVCWFLMAGSVSASTIEYHPVTVNQGVTTFSATVDGHEWGTGSGHDANLVLGDWRGTLTINENGAGEGQTNILSVEATLAHQVAPHNGEAEPNPNELAAAVTVLGIGQAVVSDSDTVSHAGAFADSDNFTLTVIANEQFPGGKIGFYTIQITANHAHVVPIPAAVWLFGSALAGLGWMRRKQIA